MMENRTCPITFLSTQHTEINITLAINDSSLIFTVRVAITTNTMTRSEVCSFIDYWDILVVINAILHIIHSHPVRWKVTRTIVGRKSIQLIVTDSKPTRGKKYECVTDYTSIAIDYAIIHIWLCSALSRTNDIFARRFCISILII